MFTAGVGALLSVLDPELDGTLQEAGADSICKLATAPDNRQKLVKQVHKFTAVCLSVHTPCPIRL